MAEGPSREMKLKAAIASTLMAGLEMARIGDAALDQTAAWSDVRISGSQAAMVTSA